MRIELNIFLKVVSYYVYTVYLYIVMGNYESL